MKETDWLEQYISTHFKSKDAFATSMDMTRQNVNAHIKKGNQKDGILPYSFKLKLKDKGIIVPNSEIEISTVNEPHEEYNSPKKGKESMEIERLLRQRVKDLETISSLKDMIIDLQKKSLEQVEATPGSKKVGGL